ncbi:MAG: hypothetical protein U1A72_14550 [Sulfuritalea sp.]|nr:hypothetical protein [Sulfuritalea sp.]
MFGIIGFAIGVGLLLNHVRMHQMFGVVNQWVSLRRSTRWLAIPRDTGADVARHRHLIGGLFILVAAYSTFVLMTQVDVPRFVAALRIDAPPALALMIVESLRWCLVVGGMVAIAVGIMMIFFQNALGFIETHANRWYSFRRHSLAGDVMHMGVERWTESHPRITGWTLTAGALVVVVAFGMTLFASR